MKCVSVFRFLYREKFWIKNFIDFFFCLLTLFVLYVFKSCTYYSKTFSDTSRLCPWPTCSKNNTKWARNLRKLVCTLSSSIHSSNFKKSVGISSKIMYFWMTWSGFRASSRTLAFLEASRFEKISFNDILIKKNVLIVYSSSKW